MILVPGRCKVYTVAYGSVLIYFHLKLKANKCGYFWLALILAVRIKVVIHRNQRSIVKSNGNEYSNYIKINQSGSATQYFVGTFNGKQFRKSGLYQQLWSDWGPDNYAGVTFSNEPNNRKLLIAWMSNWNYGQILPTEAWRGQMTLPRVLDVQRLDGKLRLLSMPAKEVESLRIPSQFYETTQPLWIRTSHNFTNELGFSNSLLEVDIIFEAKLAMADKSASFQMCFFNNFAEEICVGYSFGSNEIFLDRSLSGDNSFDCNFGQQARAQRETKN